MSRFLRNSLISIALFPVFFIVFGWQYVIPNVLFSLGNERYLSMFSDGYSREILYNETLRAIGRTDFPLAHSNLARLIQNPPPLRVADTRELYGDVLAREGSATGDILKLYQMAEEKSPSERLEKKIALLQSDTSSSASGKTPSPSKDSPGTGATDEKKTFTIEEQKSLEQSKQSLTETLEKRGQYMNPIGITPEDRKRVLRDTIEFTDTNSESIDW